VFVVSALFAAPAAQAALPTPRLTGTDPISPSTSRTPSVLGRADGVITSAIPYSSLALGAVHFDVDPNTIIHLYTNEECSGAPAFEGSAEELDGNGIPTIVPADTTTHFTADETDGTETSKCSASIAYQHMTTLTEPPKEEPTGTPPSEGGPPGTTAPGNPANPGGPSISENNGHPAPPNLHTVPGGRANDNTPVVAGTAPGAATVKIFTNAGCSGVPVAKGTVAQLGTGFTLQVPNNVSVSFYGIAVGAGGGQSACSAAVTYVEDSTPPHTRITLGPASKTRSTSPVFRFADVTDDPPGTVFLCKVDRKKWKACRTPLHLHHLKLSSHVVRIKAIDTAGNVETPGAKRRFKVVPRP
jgi:hypothetical protein